MYVCSLIIALNASGAKFVPNAPPIVQ
jgi:hypothetical protein